MFGLPSEEYEWKERASGNHVCIHSGDHVATVFNNNYAWQIIINGDDTGRIVADEAFKEHPEAISRTEEILNGADCILTVLKPSAGPITTNWKTQKKTSNGTPTYGRKHNGLGISVKKAKSGQWFYITYMGSSCSEPQGWYGSADEAMQAFDAQHPKMRPHQ